MKKTALSLVVVLGTSVLISACGAKNASNEPGNSGYNSTATRAYVTSFSEFELTYGNAKNLKDVAFISSISKEDVVRVLKHPNLDGVEKLDLSSSSISDPNKGTAALSASDLNEILPRFKNLKELNLEDHGNVTSGLIDTLTKTADLTSLNINNIQRLNDASTIQLVTGFRNLTTLSMTGMDAIGNVDLSPLHVLSNLKALSLGGSPKMNLLGLDGLDKLANLEDLTLKDIDFDLNFAQLAAAKAKIDPITSRLTSLKLISKDGDIDDTYFFLMGTFDFGSLVELTLDGTKGIGDLSIKQLEKLNRLQKATLKRGFGKKNFVSRQAVTNLLKALPNLDGSLIFKGETLL